MIRNIHLRILTVNFDHIHDLRNKQSVYGDIVEMLTILHQYEIESYNEVATQIRTSASQVLQHALDSSS